MASLTCFSRHLWQALIFLSLCTLIGCQGNQPTDENRLGSQGGNNTAAMPVVQDQSLTTEEYVQAGMPKPDQAWTGKEYAAAAKVLERLAAEPEKLPRWKSAKSGAVFDRLIQRDYLSGLFDERVSLDKRFEIFESFWPAFRTILFVYVQALQQGHKYDRECVELAAVTLYFARGSTEVADAKFKTISKTDPNYATREGGYRKMKNGINGMVLGLLITLGEKNYYRDEARLSLATHLKAELPGLFRHLTPETKKEHREKLETLIGQESNPAIKKMLQETLQSLPND